MKTNKINAAIIDDEPGCVANLNFHLQKYCPDIDIKITGHTIEDVLAINSRKDIDVAFLDIELFEENTLDLLYKQQGVDYKIVFVTAYDKYAVKAFKVEALDYLLKPLSQPEILDCYIKIRKALNKSNTTGIADEDNTNMPKHGLKKIILKQSDKVYVLRANDIYYLQAKGFYTQVIFCFNGVLKAVTISKPINKLAREYHDACFFRIHKSYLINTGHIRNIIRKNGMNVELDNNDVLPVAKRRVTDFLDYLDNKAG